jgi:E1A-binding protein p400
MDQQSEEGDATHVAKESTLVGTSFIPTNVEEETNMLVDVQQMAVVVVVASHEKTSFEDQLRPMERYVMRFLELWDPPVNNLAIEAHVLSFSASVFFLDI